eukprot:11626966-Alexandrium_andersonii.AAC.1
MGLGYYDSGDGGAGDLAFAPGGSSWYEGASQSIWGGLALVVLVARGGARVPNLGCGRTWCDLEPP